MTADGSESVAEAESAVLENLSRYALRLNLIVSIFLLLKDEISLIGLGWSGSHVRAVIATLGGLHGAARRADKWRHLYAGFTIWLSQSEAIGNLFLIFCSVLHFG